MVRLYIKNKKQQGVIFFSMEYHLFRKLKSSCFEVFGDEGYGIFEPKSWWKYGIYRLLKSSCFNIFGNGKYGLFLSQKVDGNMIFTDYWKGLVLKLSMIFQDLGNMVFRAVYFYLRSSVRISFFMRIFFVCENLFLLREPFGNSIICVNLCLFENKQAYKFHHLKKSFVIKTR